MSSRLQTNLLGRQVRLVNDQDARQLARQQGLPVERVTTVTAEQMFPVLDRSEYRCYRGQTGELVQVHLDNDGCPVYTVNFGGALEQVPAILLRVSPAEPDSGSV